jgi:hypothetical protein
VTAAPSAAPTANPTTAIVTIAPSTNTSAPPLVVVVSEAEVSESSSDEFPWVYLVVALILACIMIALAALVVVRQRNPKKLPEKMWANPGYQTELPKPTMKFGVRPRPLCMSRSVAYTNKLRVVRKRTEKTATGSGYIDLNPTAPHQRHTQLSPGYLDVDGI